jgi:hypothetical protein
MADYVVKDSSLTAVADAIREKTGDTGELIFPSGFTAAVLGISGGEGGGGFADSNLVFAEHTVTIGEDNGVDNYESFVNYLSAQLSGVTVVAYSLIGVADTYNQPVYGAFSSQGTNNQGFGCRFRNGYIDVPEAVHGAGGWVCAPVVGSQYKVYTVERIE